jgi:hypothetical protein
MSSFDTQIQIEETAEFQAYEAMQDQHYDYEDVGYGVILSDPATGDDVLLQGDDGNNFLEEVNKLDTIWLEEGNPNPSIFRCQEDHIDLLIDPYFN